jgi:hypothetical protein
MSAALKSYVPRPTPAGLNPSQNQPSTKPYSNQGSAAVTPDVERDTGRVSQPVSLAPGVSPPVLKIASRLQLVSSVLAASLVGLALVSYGATVYIERQLSQANQRLNALQRSEQQLTAANELLKSHMASQAKSPGVDLMPPKPQHVIFLRPAHQRSQPAAPGSNQSGSSLSRGARPMGY